MISAAAGLTSAVVIGIGATLAMDAWNLFLLRAFGIPSLSYCLLGRWVRHMFSGTLRHERIAAAAPKSHECAVGWTAHYTIGITLAAGFVVLTPDGWLERPTLLPALTYGIVTVVFPFFVMQPAFGLGIAGSRAPVPAHVRAKSLGTHAVFGLGLYAGALALAAMRWPG